MQQDECFVCLNCETACPEDVIKFHFLPNRKSELVKPDLQRRTILASTAAGAVAIPAMRIADWLDGPTREGDPSAGLGRRARRSSSAASAAPSA